MKDRFAFPSFQITDQITPRGQPIFDAANGMTMRQYYKAAALTGILSDIRVLKELGIRHNAEIMISRYCGELADALIAEDEKRNNDA